MQIMASPTPAVTCHNSFCGAFQDGKGIDYCKDVPKSVITLITDEYDPYYKAIVACCKLYCGDSDQTLQLQCQGSSQAMAFTIWFLVTVLALCALVQLVSIFVERGARKVTMVGGPLFLAFISVVVYLVTDKSRTLEYYMDTPYYPIVGAMSVSAFSYYFSSFQYSIGLAQELAAAIAIVFTMFPIWTLLAVNVKILEKWYYSDSDTIIRLMAWGVLAMLLLSILWILHSSVYRTVGYRAAWITAFNKQNADGHALPRGKSFLSGLWILAGAQGHPTWRTPTGQSFGLYLALLSWTISILIRKQLPCRDDLILFHILLWIPPVILTMAVLASQLTISIRASCNLQGSYNLMLLWFRSDFQSQRETYAQYYEAVISYRLGRDSLEAEERGGIKKYRLIVCCGRIRWLDDALAIFAWSSETVTFALAYPGIIVLGISQWLIGKCILKYTRPAGSSEPADDDGNHDEQSSGGGCSLWRVCRDWFPMHGRLTLSEKIEAYRTLCENWVGRDAGMHYECSVNVPDAGNKPIHKCSSLTGIPFQVDAEVRAIFRNHRQEITLPLLLDNTGPSRLSYLLQELAGAMNEARSITTTTNGSSPTNGNGTA